MTLLKIGNLNPFTPFKYYMTLFKKLVISSGMISLHFFQVSHFVWSISIAENYRKFSKTMGLIKISHELDIPCRAEETKTVTVKVVHLLKQKS